MTKTARRKSSQADQQTAADLRLLLAQRHVGDVFVPECKTGSTGEGLLKLDAWAMKRSWADPLTWGYEIKVSRSDFTGDQKWHNYLRYCSEFYFVAPLGLIAVDELPPEAGLLVCAKTGNRLLMKKKAQRRQVTIPEDLFRYVLMWRAGIFGENTNHSESTDFWRNWMRQRDADKELGYRVSQKIGELVRERITTVECNQKLLNKKLEKYAELEAMLERAGFNTDWMPRPEQVMERLRHFDEVVSPDFVWNLTSISREALAIIEKIEKRRAEIKG